MPDGRARGGFINYPLFALLQHAFACCMRPGVLRDSFVEQMMSSAVARATARPATTWAQHARRLLQTTPQRLAYITKAPHGRWAVLTHAKAQGRRPPPAALGRPPPTQTSPSAPAPCAQSLPKRLPRARPLLSRALCLPYLPPSPYNPQPYYPEVEGDSRSEAHGSHSLTPLRPDMLSVPAE